MGKDIYGWQIKKWAFNEDNVDIKRKEMVDWCEKWSSFYSIREIFVDNAWAVEYKLLTYI